MIISGEIDDGPQTGAKLYHPFTKERQYQRVLKSLYDHASKVLLQIINNRIERKLENEITKESARF